MSMSMWQLSYSRIVNAYRQDSSKSVEFAKVIESQIHLDCVILCRRQFGFEFGFVFVLKWAQVGQSKCAIDESSQNKIESISKREREENEISEASELMKHMK